MSRVLFMSDLHLGHRNIAKYRPIFSSAEEHHNTVFENLATNLRKRDHLVLCGDVAFTHEWLAKIGSLKCLHKTLILGNHDVERGINFTHFVGIYDNVQSLWSKRNFWISHCPIHPDEMRSKLGNIHGHTHSHILEDKRYINVCVEHTGYKPITFGEIQERANS